MNPYSGQARAGGLYEVKHNGYRLMVRRQDDNVRIYTRRGTNWTKRFPKTRSTGVSATSY